MPKYIDAEKLKAKMERLKDEYTDIAVESPYGTVNANSVVVDLKWLLSLIGSLQQEQQEEPDKSVEEAAEKSSVQYYKDAGYSPFPNVETAAHEAGFIAGAKWQAEKCDEETSKLLYAEPASCSCPLISGTLW
jgi:hypothetical protein